jgi:hypothetical protein
MSADKMLCNKMSRNKMSLFLMRQNVAVLTSADASIGLQEPKAPLGRRPGKPN